MGRPPGYSDFSAFIGLIDLSIFLKFTFHCNLKLTFSVVKYFGLPFNIKFKAENNSEPKVDIFIEFYIVSGRHYNLIYCEYPCSSPPLLQ